MLSRVVPFISALPLVSVGCASFVTVRSADVRAGPSLTVQASASTRPGDVAGWFWSLDCVEACNHPVIGADLGATYGWRLARGPHAVALGAGISGESPYVDGYAQLTDGRRPFGVGARVGLPVTSWRDHQLYARYDAPIGQSTRVLVNPGVFLHQGRAPNGASPGRFLAFVQGVGIQFEGDHVSWTPAVALVAGTAQHNSYGARYGPVRSVFATASLGMTLHRKREPSHR